MIQFLAALTALGVLIGVGWLLSRPYLAVLLIVVMYCLEQLVQSYIPFLQAHYALFNYLCAVLIVLALLMRISKRDPVFMGLHQPVTWLVAGQFALWLIAMVYTPAPDVAMANLRANWPYVFINVLMMPLLVVSLAEFRRILIGLMIVGSAIAVLIIVNPNSSYHNGRLLIDLGMMDRSRSSEGNPLALAEMGGLMALTAVLLVPPSRSQLFSLLRIGAFVSGLGLAIGSGSRGQVFATVVAGILFYPMARRVNNPKNFIFACVGAVGLVGAIYGVFQLFIGDQNRERWRVDTMVEHVSMRFDMVHRFLDAYLAKPSHWLFGLGTNSWSTLSSSDEIGGNYVHNIAIEILCEHGLVGITIFIASIVLVARASRRLWLLYADDPAMRSVVTVLTAFGAFTLFLGLKQGDITGGTPFCWWLVLAKIGRYEALTHVPATAAEESYEEDELAEYLHEDHPGYAIAR